MKIVRLVSLVLTQNQSGLCSTKSQEFVFWNLYLREWTSSAHLNSSCIAEIQPGRY
jgi:hypothetical protein